MTGQRTMLTCTVDCMGFEMASLEVEEAVAPRTKGWQMVDFHGSYSRRVRDVPLCNHPRDHQSCNRNSPLMSSFCPLGLWHPVKEKDEDRDIVVGETMEVNEVDEMKKSRSTRVQPKTWFHGITSLKFLCSLLQNHSVEPASSQPTGPGFRIWAKSASTSMPRTALRAICCSKSQLQGSHLRLCPRSWPRVTRSCSRLTAPFLRTSVQEERLTCSSRTGHTRSTWSF